MNKRSRTRRSADENLGENEYFVEKILKKNIIDGGVYYLIKWEGYPLAQCTWEPEKNLLRAQELLDDFEAQHANGFGRKGKAEVRRLKPRLSKTKRARVAKSKGGRIVDRRPSRRHRSSESEPSTQSESVALQRTRNHRVPLMAHNKKSEEEPLPEPSEIYGYRRKANGESLEYLIEWKMDGKEQPLSAFCSSQQLAKHWPELLIGFLEKTLLQCDEHKTN